MAEVRFTDTAGRTTTVPMFRPALFLATLALMGTVSACTPTSSPSPASGTSGPAPANTAAPSSVATSPAPSSSAGGSTAPGAKQASTATLPQSVEGWTGTPGDDGSGKTRTMIYAKLPDTALATLVADSQAAGPMADEFTNTQKIGNATCGSRPTAQKACYMKLDGGILILSSASPGVDNTKLAQLTEAVYKSFR